MIHIWRDLNFLAYIIRIVQILHMIHNFLSQKTAMEIPAGAAKYFFVRSKFLAYLSKIILSVQECSDRSDSSYGIIWNFLTRRCIQNNECAMPNCEFGEYIKWQGKCPRKRDTFDAMTSYRANLSHRFRS